MPSELGAGPCLARRPGRWPGASSPWPRPRSAEPSSSSLWSRCSCDALTGVSLGRRLTPSAPARTWSVRLGHGSPPVRLIITANYDSGRMGLVHRRPLRRPAARLRGAARPAVAGLARLSRDRLPVGSGHRRSCATRAATGATIAVLQLIPTAGLVLGSALLLELGSAGFGPGAGDNATGTALAVALARALDVAPPQRLGDRDPASGRRRRSHARARPSPQRPAP